jgi:16S rRNA (guanine966-N2)-methyltransferase
LRHLLLGFLRFRVRIPRPLRTAQRHRGGVYGQSVRVIAGEFRGRRIDAPKGTLTRPTSDFVRETAFNLIGPVDGATVIDLYAGSGALGLEALSRGAAGAVFVDSSREACRTIAHNLEQLGVRAIVHCNDVARALAGERGSYDLILADPPYTFADYANLAAPLARILAPHGLVVLQTPAAAEPILAGLETRTSRRYGSARLTLFGT